MGAGLLAPHARWRSQVVGYGRPAPDSNAPEPEARPRAAGPPGAWSWAALMRRVFDVDVLACPRCGGRLRVIATVQDLLAVQAILAPSAARSLEPPGPAPLELIEKLSILIPPPRFHPRRCHGLLAPPAGWRSPSVPRPGEGAGQAGRGPAAGESARPGTGSSPGPAAPAGRPSWAAWLARVFVLDVFQCPPLHLKPGQKGTKPLLA